MLSLAKLCFCSFIPHPINNIRQVSSGSLPIKGHRFISCAPLLNIIILIVDRDVQSLDKIHEVLAIFHLGEGCTHLLTSTVYVVLWTMCRMALGTITEVLQIPTLRTTAAT